MAATFDEDKSYNMAAGQQERRMQILQGHLSPPLLIEKVDGMLSREVTAAEFVKGEGYSVALPEKLKENRWNVYRYAIENYTNHPCFGTRIRPNGTVGKYEWLNYKEAGDLRTAIGSGIAYLGLEKGSKVGLYFINRAEWMITDLACMAYGFVSVPLYDTLGPDAVKYIINHAELSIIFCTRDKLTTVMDCLAECPSVRTVVGRANPRPFSPLDPEDMVSICYTSGTTGVPKGAMLTNRSIVASSAGACHGAIICPGDVHLSYLPLAHIYEKLNVISLIHFGAAIGFYQGDVLKIMDDLDALKPTIFASVPRLYNRIYDRIIATVKSSGGLREYLFNVAYNAKKHALEKGTTPSPVWDRLVFNKIKARLGGRVRVMITGASPISQEVFDFLKICFGARVVEGYGMTETTCTITSMDEDDTTSGHVGSPSPACEVKLADVPEMEYMSTDRPNPRGEICVRGPILFKGYYKDEVQTQEIIDSEGWLHTGDVGMWLPGGRLKIIDRKKNIFKLAQGEYIAPEKIENVYQKSPFIAQSFVHGDSLNSSLVAIVVLDPETTVAWAKNRGILHAEDLNQLAVDPVMKAAVLADMDKVAQEAKLRGFEFVKNIHLVAEAFTLENGLLTPTFKIKRPQAKVYFEKEIVRMYEELKQLELAPKPGMSKL